MRTSDDDRRDPDDEEGRCVDDHRDLQSTGGRKHPADHRTDGEAGVATRFHSRIREGEARLAGDAWDERELGRLCDCEADAEERGETEDHGRPGREGQSDRH